MSSIPSLRIRSGFPAGNPLVADHLAGGKKGLERFGSDFREEEAYRRVAASVEKRFDRGARERAARAIHAPHAAGRERLRRVVEEGGFFVTTGQQPGLFGGPLYGVLKALSAIRLADALEPVVGRPVAPLFWVASEDHDWDEVDHAWIIDPQNELHRVRLEVPGRPAGAPIFRTPLGNEVHRALESFASLLPPSEFKEADLALLRSAWREGAHLGESFAEYLGTLLGSFGLLLTDAAHPALKEGAIDLLRSEAEDGAPGEALLAEVAEGLRADGFPIQVPILPGGVNLFLEGPGGRDRLYRTSSGFRLHRSGVELTLPELRDRIAADPSILSPNVLLRPVVESHIFPVLSYVAGPGEMAYWAQLREYFAHHGLEFPVVHPRFSALLVEGKIGRVLNRFQLEPDALARPVHELASELLREEMPEEVRTALREARKSLGSGVRELTQAVRAIDATLKGPIEAVRNQAFMGLDEVERRIVQALRKREEVELGQLARAALHLYPDGAFQERRISPFYFTARYGEEVVRTLLHLFDPPVRKGRSGGGEGETGPPSLPESAPLG